MTTHPNPTQTPTGEDRGDVQVSVEAILAAYAREVATLTQRAVMAETARDAALAEVARLHDADD